jgi:hypothetical protein
MALVSGFTITFTENSTPGFYDMGRPWQIVATCLPSVYFLAKIKISRRNKVWSIIAMIIYTIYMVDALPGNY